MDADSHPLSDDGGRWQTVIEECRALAEDYEEDGWTVFAPVPGDVVPLPAPTDSKVRKVGFDLLLSGDEFARLEELVTDATFDEFEAFRAQDGGVVYLSLVFKAPAAETAFCVPMYYRVADADRMLDRVRAGDPLRAYFHPLAGEDDVAFDLQDPSLVFPPEDVA
ncbi:MAG: DUF7529 family protein [Halanaeroarchaeum sp.]